MSVVCIGREDDAHIPFVTKHLRENPILIDYANILNGQNFSYKYQHGSIELFVDGEPLHNVSGVWLRHPRDINAVSFNVEEYLQEYTLAIQKEFMQLLYTHFPEAVWVSDYYAIKRASSKTLQLVTAQKLGFKTPRTIFTSSVSEAQAFVKSCKNGALAKTLSNAGFKKDGLWHGMYAAKVNQDTNFTGLSVTPTIFQECIDVQQELRITVVGNEVFAASISGDAIDRPESNIRDWRIANYKGTMHIHAVTLSEKIRKQCVALVREFGLSFGAIDMIVDSRGTYWFLENNANGQWAFVEEKTGQPIGKAIALLLESGPRRLG